MTPEPVRWLWKDWLALGKLHILAGAPGEGKTTLATKIAATVTTGGAWPDSTKAEEGNILVWSGEDDVSDTLLPRLMAAGAKKEKCYFVSGTKTASGERPFDPAVDLSDLEQQANLIGGISLLIVDPVVSVVTGDSHKNTEVRRALQPLVELAKRLDAAVLGISHFSKGGAGLDPAMRVVGSVAFTAVARIVLVAAKVRGEEAGDARRVLARAKSNIGPDDGGFEYFIEQTELIPGIHASQIVWGQTLNGTAKDLFAEPEDELIEGDEGKTLVAQAMEFLEQVLAEGLAPAKEVTKQANEAGITPRTLRRARERLPVIVKKGSNGAWYWKLPTSDREGSIPDSEPVDPSLMTNQVGHDVQRQNDGQDGHLGQDTDDVEKSLSQIPQDGQLVQGFETGQLDGQVTSRPDDFETF